MRSLLGCLSVLAALCACQPMSPPGAGGGGTGADAGAGAPGSGTGERYHPANFAEAGVHGLEMKLQTQDCRTCHGDQLQGMGASPSCDSCHQETWRTDCTYCHGGDDNPTGAPPGDLDPNAIGAAFAAHSVHVTSTLTGSTGCAQCHRMPTDVLSVDHAFDDSPGQAESYFGGGVATSTLYSGTGCSNNWCHGDGQTPGQVATSQSVTACSSCHASNDTADQWRDMSGSHLVHLINPSMDCTSCHLGTTRSDPLQVSNPARHINGTADVLLSEDTITYDPVAETCSGICHLFPHPNLPWRLLGAQ